MGYPFVQASNYTPANRKTIDLIIIHTMEAPETVKTAENVAAWFAGSSAPRASAHYCIDSDSIVQCVKDQDVAWHAPGANHNGLGFEHAGTANQTSEQWQDDYSQATLHRSARLAAEKCSQYGIPPVRLIFKDLLAGKRGITGHLDCTMAFGGTHTDPGYEFPWGQYLALIASYMPSFAYWLWVRWRLGEGEFKDYGPASREHRPASLPKWIPPWWWVRLAAFLAKRKVAS